MDKPKRKQTRLKEYDYSQNGAYFVTICTQNMENLFGEIIVNDVAQPLAANVVGATLCGRPHAPHLMVEKWLLELENKYKNVKIDKYVIMPNHIHFILIIDNGTVAHTGATLQEMMDWFKTMTTNEYIRGVKSGLFVPFNKHFWQRGFHEHVIQTQESYDKIWIYIDNNPLKWELDKYYSE